MSSCLGREGGFNERKMDDEHKRSTVFFVVIVNLVIAYTGLGVWVGIGESEEEFLALAEVLLHIESSFRQTEPSALTFPLPVSQCPNKPLYCLPPAFYRGGHGLQVEYVFSHLMMRNWADFIHIKGGNLMPASLIFDFRGKHFFSKAA